LNRTYSSSTFDAIVTEQLGVADRRRPDFPELGQRSNVVESIEAR
jgi:hypothetical protein